MSRSLDTVKRLQHSLHFVLGNTGAAIAEHPCRYSRRRRASRHNVAVEHDSSRAMPIGSPVSAHLPYSHRSMRSGEP